MTDLSEAALQAAVVDMARRCGYLHMHIHDSRKSSGAGFPDLVLCHRNTGRVIFVELKSAKGKLRPEQEVWLRALQRRSEAFVWRPEDWPAQIRHVLTTDPMGAAA